MEDLYNSYNYTGLVPVPWPRLWLAGNNTEHLRERLFNLTNGEAAAKELVSSLGWLHLQVLSTCRR